MEIIHGAKSLLGALGAVSLQQRCIELQQALRAGRAVPAEVSSLGTAYAELLGSLRRIFMDTNEAKNTSRAGVP